MSDNFTKNGSGCVDPTAYNAIKNTEEEIERYGHVIHTIHMVCKAHGFSVDGRIQIKDERTGKVWR